MSAWRGESLARRRPVLALLVAAALCTPTFFAPPVAPAAECAGDECQPPALPPDDPIPGTSVVNGPPNPPVHYPKVHKKHRHHHRGDR
jgi:hypothetical protein